MDSIIAIGTSPGPHLMRPLLGLLFLLAVAATPARAADAAPATRAPAGTATTVQARFEQPDQTIEYHFMLRVAPMREESLATTFPARVAAPLAPVATVGALDEGQACGYVDSKTRELRKRNLIVRVREGRITLKARGPSPAQLLDLQSCRSKKYEMDYFGTRDYSISSDIKIMASAGGVSPTAGDASHIWELIARECPAAWRQVQPAVAAAGACEIPGVARMYSADVTLKHANAARVKEAGVTVWFFSPTGRTLVELAFTGYVKDRGAMDRMYADLKASLRSAGLLAADQSSKTAQYFAAYEDTAGSTRQH